MMRIMEAIQRKKLIQLLNDEYNQDMENDASNSYIDSRKGSNNNDDKNKVLSPLMRTSTSDGSSFLSFINPSSNSSSDPVKDKERQELIQFAEALEHKLTDLQKKALKITWKRLSEAPRTSRKGMLYIMEKIFDLLIEKNPQISTVFYRSAFLSCLEDRKNICTSSCNSSRTNSDAGILPSSCPYKSKTIATLRDHANILLDFVNSVICLMFDIPYQESSNIGILALGCSHARLTPLGFDREWFHQLGECFAEVMFSQECIRAFPHAASAWSLFAVTFTDKLYVESRWRKTPASPSISSLTISSSSIPFSFSLNHMNKPCVNIPINSIKKYSDELPSKKNSKLYNINEGSGGRNKH